MRSCEFGGELTLGSLRAAGRLKGTVALLRRWNPAFKPAERRVEGLAERAMAARRAVEVAILADCPKIQSR